MTFARRWRRGSDGTPAGNDRPGWRQRRHRGAGRGREGRSGFLGFARCVSTKQPPPSVVRQGEAETGHKNENTKVAIAIQIWFPVECPQKGWPPPSALRFPHLVF